MIVVRGYRRAILSSSITRKAVNADILRDVRVRAVYYASVKEQNHSIFSGSIVDPGLKVKITVGVANKFKAAIAGKVAKVSNPERILSDAIWGSCSKHSR